MEDKAYDISKQLGNASMYIGLGLIGVVIPLFGFIFGGMAVGKINGVLNYIETDDSLYRKFYRRSRSLQSSSAVVILISIISAIVWFAVLASHH